MSVDPSYPMQVALFAALSGSTDLQAFIGSPARVYDQVPINRATSEPTFPYVTIFDAHVVDDWAEGIIGSEVYCDVHVWSRAVGHGEAKKIADAVRQVMCQTLQPAGHVVVVFEYVTTRHMTDPDGVTAHSIVTVRYSTEPTA